MGFFSGKKTIVVSSTVYNMAGDLENRANFLKSSMFSAVMSPHDVWIGETIVGNYLTGPGMKQRQFFRWCVNNDFAGLPSFSAKRSYPVDPEVVKGFIPVPGSPAGLVTYMQNAYVEDGDFTVFAEQYILANSPELVNSAWTCDYNLASHEITIQYELGGTDVIPAGTYDGDGQFIVANYYQAVPASVEPVDEGTLVEDENDAGNLPDNTDFTQDSLTNTGVVTHTLITDVTVLKEYSDATPDDGPTTTYGVSEDVDYNGQYEILSKTVYQGGDGNDIGTTSIETFNNVWEFREKYNDTTIDVVVNDLGGGVSETVTTTTVGDHLRPIYDYRVDTQDTIYSKTVGGSQIFIYKMGSGTVGLDALQEDLTVTEAAEFFPYIPIRLNNVSITDDVYANLNEGDNTAPFGNGLYDELNTAYRKAIPGQHFYKLVDEVEDNDDLSEIDYAYLCWGVPLNVEDKSSQKYLYEFFLNMIPFQNTTSTYMLDFQAEVAAYNQAHADLQDWLADQGTFGSTLFGALMPDIPFLGSPETTTITVKSSDPRMQDYDNRITWINIDEEIFAGLGQVGAVKGDIWITKGTDFTWTEQMGLGGSTHDEAEDTQRTVTNKIEAIYIFHQTGDATYKRLTVHGLVHKNYIYGGKSVRITAHEALDDSDESGFLLPIHYPTVRGMSLVDSTQLATANTFLIFNSYKIYKKKWYQTFLGMLLIVILLVVAAAIIAPAAVGGISGIFGANAAVGGALGLSGTGAVVAGAVANALAAVIISTAISSVSTEIFGEKWGAIIGSLISFAFTFGMGGGFTNFGMSSIMNAQTIMGFTSALANGYSGWTAANIAEIRAQMEENSEKHGEEMDKIEDLLNDLLGNNDLSFNPMELMDAATGNGSRTGNRSYTPEMADEFIHRTTLSGSDIVDITLSMVTDYPALARTLPT